MFIWYWFCNGKYLEFNQRGGKIYSANLKALGLEEYVNQPRAQDSSEKREVVDERKDLRSHPRTVFCKKKWDVVRSVPGNGVQVPWGKRTEPLRSLVLA